MTGIVCWWPFAIVDIPNGWHLCDGTNGTPDYRNYLLIGAGDLYTPGQVIGSLTHNHTGSAQNDSHGHEAETAEVDVGISGATDEESDFLIEGDYINSNYPGGDISKETYGHVHDVAFDADTHEHDVEIFSDTHGHTLTVNPANHLPPCKAGCWIMKL